MFRSALGFRYSLKDDIPMKSYFALMMTALAVGTLPLTVSCSGGGSDETVAGYSATTEYDADIFFAGRSEIWLQPTDGLTYVRLISNPGSENPNYTTGQMQLVGPGMVVTLDVTFERMEETEGTLGWPGISIGFTSVSKSSPNLFPIQQYTHLLSAEMFLEVKEVQLAFREGNCRVELTAVQDPQDPPAFWFYENGDWKEAVSDDFKPYMWAGLLFDSEIRVYRKHF